MMMQMSWHNDYWGLIPIPFREVYDILRPASYIFCWCLCNVAKFLTHRKKHDNHRHAWPTDAFDLLPFYPFCSLCLLVRMSYVCYTLHLVQSSLAVQHIMESSQESSLDEK